MQIFAYGAIRLSKYAKRVTIHTVVVFGNRLFVDIMEELNNNTQQQQDEASVAQLQSDKMRNTKIGKLLISMSLPAIISMLVQSLYNIVDSLFLTGITYKPIGYVGSNVGKDSFNAVSIVMPMTMIVVAIGIGIGVGANAYIARKLGEDNRKHADKCAKTAVIMAIASWLVMVALAFVVSKPFMRLFVNEQGALYLEIYMAGSVGVIMDITCARMLQATGNMKIPMITQLVGAVTNIALDALFIVGFKWGVLGAILATVIGQWVAAAIDIVAFFARKQDVSISLKGFRPQKKYFFHIFKIGLPAFIMNAMNSVVTIVLNSFPFCRRTSRCSPSYLCPFSGLCRVQCP